MELREVTFKIKRNDGFEKEYTMRETIGEEDLAFIHQFTNPQNGAIDARSLWIKRFIRCLVLPKLSEAELKMLPNWELQGLMLKWMELNNPDMTSFLETSKEKDGIP